MASTTKKFSYKLVKTGNVVLTASTDLRGYVVGQVLRLQADIENQSGKDTSPVVASLLQVRALWLPEPVPFPWDRKSGLLACQSSQPGLSSEGIL